uniref:Uncharacterized protein n=1 Tax=viral metagenome TaxID=1070528 RepID=A0A6C0KHS8_9ZZZZ
MYKKWLWAAIAIIIITVLFFFLRSRRSHEHSSKSSKPKKDSVKIILDSVDRGTLEKWEAVSSSPPSPPSTTIAKRLAGTVTDQTGTLVNVYDSDTVDVQSGLTYLQESKNLIGSPSTATSPSTGQESLLELYKNIMGKDPVLCFRLQPVSTRFEMYGNTSGNGTVVPFINKFQQNMNILNDLIIYLLTPINQTPLQYGSDMFRNLGAIMLAQIFTLNNAVAPNTYAITRTKNQNGLDVSVTFSMNSNHNLVGLNSSGNITTKMLNPLPPSPPNWTKVFSKQNQQVQSTMNAAKQYLENIARSSNSTTIGGTPDGAAAEAMSNILNTKTSSVVLIEDLGRILLLSAYYGPFYNTDGVNPTNVYPCGQ